MKTTSYFFTQNTRKKNYETNFLQLYNSWYSDLNSYYTSPSELVTANISNPSFDFDLLTTFFAPTTTEAFLDSTSRIQNGQNCTNVKLYFDAKHEYKPIVHFLNIVNYTIIIVGIFFNIINLFVLLKSKLNESPYSYLTMLALSDLGALAMVGAEKIRQLFPNSSIIHIYFVMMINIFLSCSMSVTLALTIERFIFVHSPFKAMTICRRSIARKVCCVIFLFSVLRSTYLPLMYTQNCWDGFSQKKDNLVDLYEFLISLAIPYTIILIANISLILSLKKQNNLMSIPVSPSTNSITIKNGEINFSKSKLKQDSLNETDGSDSVCEQQKKLTKSTLSLEIEKETKPLKPKVLIHSNTINSISTSINPSRFSNTSLKTKTSSLYHRTSNIREIKNQKKLTITLVTILCLLLVCYLPSFLFEKALADFIFGPHDVPTKDSVKAFKIKAIGYRIAIILIYFNCMANFLIYCFCNKKFKNSLKILIKKSFLNKLYRRCLFLCEMYCFKGKKNFTNYTIDLEQSNNNVNNNVNNNNCNNHHNVGCSYYNTYHFKYYQQNNKIKNSLKETTINETNKIPVIRKTKSLIVK